MGLINYIFGSRRRFAAAQAAVAARTPKTRGLFGNLSDAEIQRKTRGCIGDLRGLPKNLDIGRGPCKITGAEGFFLKNGATLKRAFGNGGVEYYLEGFIDDRLLTIDRPGGNKLKAISPKSWSSGAAAFDGHNNIYTFKIYRGIFPEDIEKLLCGIGRENVSVTMIGQFDPASETLNLPFNWGYVVRGEMEGRAAAEVYLADGFLAGGDFFLFGEISTIEDEIAVSVRKQDGSAEVIIGDTEKAISMMRIAEASVNKEQFDTPYFAEPAKYSDDAIALMLKYRPGFFAPKHQLADIRILCLPIDPDRTTMFTAASMTIQSGRSPFTGRTAKEFVFRP